MSLTVGLAFSVAACDDDTPASPDAGLALDETTFLAIESDAVLAGIIGIQFASMDPAGGLATASDVVLATAVEPIVTEFDFTRTAPCPAGGQNVAEGSGVRTFDRDTREFEMDASGSRTIQACARVRGDVTFTSEGSGTWTAHRRRVDGAADGLQTLDQEGSVTITASDGRSESCDYELHRVYDPETDQVTLTGFVCDREIDRTFGHDGHG